MLARVAKPGAPAHRARATIRHARSAASARSASGGSASGAPLVRARAIAPTIHGAPMAARPIITARAPEAASIARASSRPAAIAVDDDGRVDRGDHLADRAPVGAAGVALAARARVNRDHRRARLHGAARQRGALR